MDESAHGKGLGADLLADAIQRARQGANDVGAATLQVHTRNEEAKAFYPRYHFQPSPVDELTLMTRF